MTGSIDPKHSAASDEATLRLFRKWSPFYDSLLTKLFYFDRVQPYIVEMLSAMIKDLHGEGPKVIDVACGTGEIIHKLAARFPGVSFVGVDFSGDMIGVARMKCAGMANVELVPASAAHLPFADASFDLSICTDALHHFSMPGESLGEMCRVTKNASCALVADPAYDTFFQRMVVGLFGKLLDKPQRYYPRNELCGLLTREDFSIISYHYRYLTNIFIVRKNFDPSRPGATIEGYERS